jgi:argininosuccinate lyase
LTLDQWLSLSDKFDESVFKVFDFETSVENRNALGGPARAMVIKQIEGIRAKLAAN